MALKVKAVERLLKFDKESAEKRHPSGAFLDVLFIHIFLLITIFHLQKE